MLMRVFLNADGLNRETRQMVIDGLPPAIRASSGKLHPFQSQYLAIVNEMLVELSQDAERRQHEHKGKLDLLKNQVEERMAANEAAVKKIEDAKRLVQEKTSELKECEKTTQEIEKEHEQMLDIRTKEEERRAELDTCKAEVTSILEGPFQLLLEGECEGEPLAMAVKAVDAFLKRIGTEPALVAAAVRALAVKPDSRRDFDVLTISHVKQTLETQLNKVNTLIDDYQPKYRSVAAEQLGLWALLDEEKSILAAAKAALVDAEVSLMTAQELCSSAGKEVKARSDAVSQQLCEQVIVDDLVKEIAGAHGAAARLAAFDYEAITPMEVVEESVAAAAPDASAPDTSAVDTAGSVDVSMAATTG
jgi:hypothetical protein